MDLTADQLVGADGAKVSDARKHAPVRDEAAMILRQLLADGPMPADEATRITKANADCGVKTVREAAKHIRVVKKPVRLDKKIDRWTWELPQEHRVRVVDDGDTDEPEES